MSDEMKDEVARGLASRAMQVAEAADKLSLATSHQSELLEHRMDSFEKMDTERRQTNSATLLRIEEGVAGLYRRMWSAVIWLLVSGFGMIVTAAAIAFWLGDKLSKVP